MAEQTGECWAVWGKGVRGHWYCWAWTLSDTRRRAIQKAEDGETGWWNRERSKGMVKCVRTTLTARLP